VGTFLRHSVVWLFFPCCSSSKSRKVKIFNSIFLPITRAMRTVSADNLSWSGFAVSLHCNKVLPVMPRGVYLHKTEHYPLVCAALAVSREGSVTAAEVLLLHLSSVSCFPAIGSLTAAVRIRAVTRCIRLFFCQLFAAMFIYFCLYDFCRRCCIVFSSTCIFLRSQNKRQLNYKALTRSRTDQCGNVFFQWTSAYELDVWSLPRLCQD